MVQKLNKTVSFLILGLLVLCGCGDKPFSEQYKTIPEANWHKDSIADFVINVTDTTSFYNFYLHLRNNNEYPYSNFYSFFTITFPNNRTAKDTLNLPLADLKGKWLGTGLGDTKSNRFLFKERLQFPLKGNYQFSVKQGMREDNLEGISDVGLEVSLHQ
ncbi:MAG: gliding motility-associated lipoprotein GldH [Flavobacteriales bacterium]|jgi:gliding motility-associated lipoprotein GldH